MKLSDVAKASVIRLAADLKRTIDLCAHRHRVLVVLRTILRHARHIDAMTTDPFAGIDPKTLRSLRRANIAFVDDCVFVDDQLAPAKPGAAAGTGIGTNRFPLTPDL